MGKITTATQDQWAAIDDLRDRWIANQTIQHDDADIINVVHRMYAATGEESPVVLIAPSPLSMVVWAATAGEILQTLVVGQLHSQLNSQLDSQLRSQLHSQLRSQLDSQLDSQLRSQPWYLGYWWRVWSGCYRGAEVLGVKFDEQKLNLFSDWNDMASCWCAYRGLCVVSRNPTEVHWLDGELHKDAGPAVVYSDGWGHYAISGVAVDEQIVMRPETQSISQIAEENNEEVKRIRIERYGWERYIKDVQAKVVDHRRNDVDGTYEALFVMSGGMKAFCGRCRSTGRVYFLEVDPGIRTCEQSQKWMLGDRQGNIIGAS